MLVVSVAAFKTLGVALRVGAARVVRVVGKLLEVQGASEVDRNLLIKRREIAGKGLGGRRTRAGRGVHAGDLVVRAREANGFVDHLGYCVTVGVAGDLSAAGVGLGRQGDDRQYGSLGDREDHG